MTTWDSGREREGVTHIGHPTGTISHTHMHELRWKTSREMSSLSLQKTRTSLDTEATSWGEHTNKRAVGAFHSWQWPQGGHKDPARKRLCLSPLVVGSGHHTDGGTIGSPLDGLSLHPVLVTPLIKQATRPQ